MKKEKEKDWKLMSAEEKAVVYEKLADKTLPGFSRDTYLEMAKKLRTQTKENDNENYTTES